MSVFSASMYCTARYVAASTVNATPRTNSASTAPRRFDPNAARISGVDPKRVDQEARDRGDGDDPQRLAQHRTAVLSGRAPA